MEQLTKNLKCPKCGGTNLIINGNLHIDYDNGTVKKILKDINFKALCNDCNKSGNLLSFQPESCHTCDRRTVGENPTSCMFEKEPKVIENPRETRCKFYKRIKL